MTIEILQTQRLLHICEEMLAERFVVHKLFEAEDKPAFLAQVAPRVRAIAGGQANAALMAALPGLEIISGFGVGYDTIDVDAARKAKVRVTNTPDVLNDAVAELTIGLMIALARRIPQADRFVREGKWLAGGFPLQTELTGKTVGIVGLGRIGKEVASRAQGLKMRVVYQGRNRQPKEPHVYYDDVVAMARDVDVLVVLAPGGAETQGMISRQVLEALGPQGMLISISRGTLVDEAALVELLVSGGLGAAALDVFEKEPHVPQALVGLDNVVLSPHLGSATHTTRRAMCELLVANLDAHFAGRPLPSAVV